MTRKHIVKRPAAWQQLIAAMIIAGLIIAGFAIYFGSSYSEHQRYPAYRDATDKVIEVDPALPQAGWGAQPFAYRFPCQQPKGQGESDLCAQWKAAYAAEENAFWAKWGVWVAGVSTIFVAYALRQTVISNRIARDTAVQELRAYVDIESVRFRPDPKDKDPELMRNSGLVFITRNYGATPGKDIAVDLDVSFIDRAGETYSGPTRYARVIPRISPGQQITSREIFPVFRTIKEQIDSNYHRCVVVASLTYLDEFNEEHRHIVSLISNGFDGPFIVGDKNQQAQRSGH